MEAFMRAAFQIIFSVAAALLASTSAKADTTRILENYSRVPLAFTLNNGQTDSRVKFTASGSGCDLFFTPSGTTFLLSRETDASLARRAARKSVAFKPASDSAPEPEIERESFALKVAFAGANDSPEVVGEDRLPWNNNYFIGKDPAKWRTDVPNFAKIRLKEVYDGVDLVYYGNKNRIKYDFVVRPGEDPSKITLTYDLGENAGNALSINSSGELVIKTPLGVIREQKPYCYQRIEGKEVEIGIAYRIVDAGENLFGFEIGEYDKRYDLYIDPEIVYSTFLGGDSFDHGEGIAVDSSGNAYVAGFTESPGYPVTTGAHNTHFDSRDPIVVVSKLNPNGNGLVYSTFLGGSRSSHGYAIAVDSYGNAYVTGSTYSSDFPVTDGAYDTSHNGSNDVFAVKLNPSGSNLLYSTLIGGKGYDRGFSIAVDTNGNAHITGLTSGGSGTPFPTTAGAFDTSINVSVQWKYDIFVTKVNASGSDLLYSTFLGNCVLENRNGIAVDSFGNAFVSGSTDSPEYPVTSGAFDTSCSGVDVFVTKLNTSGTGLVYSTFIGGNGNDYGQGIAVDISGNAYVTGYTSSPDYPSTSGAYDTSCSGRDVFVTQLTADGGGLLYSTFIGGSGEDYGHGIAIDNSGNLFLCGVTRSSDYPVTAGAFDVTFNGGYWNAFATKLNAESGLVYSTYLGISSDLYHSITGIAIDGMGGVYVAGATNSPLYPVSSDSFDRAFNGGFHDIFVTKLEMTPNGPLAVTSPNGSGYWITGTTQDIAWVSEGVQEGPVTIDLFRDRGATFDRTIVSSTPNTGSYAWTIPAEVPAGADYRVRVTSLDDSTFWDHNDGDFRITPVGNITLSSLNYGGFWTIGTTKKIVWTSDSVTENAVKIELFRESGATFDRTIISSTPNTGSYYWTIPDAIPDGEKYRIRVTSLSDPSVWDQNDMDFWITRYVAVDELPIVFSVSPPFPNPFNPSTSIRLEIPESLHVRVVVYDILGQEVRVLRDDFMSAGRHTLVWDGRNDGGSMTASGVYFYTVRAGTHSARGKMLFLR